VSAEFSDLLSRCLDLSRLTGGAFDITVGPLKKLYNFKGGDFDFPSKKIVREVQKKIGYSGILFPGKNLVALSEKGMQISFAAIGKGYAADRVRKFWKENGVRSGVVNASGDLATVGLRPDGSPWNIGIGNPANREEILFRIPLKETCVATSGDYEQFFFREGIRYSHNINPFTGLPVQGIKSATVISPSAELSDALATAVFVMGSKEGVNFINQLPSTHCLIIDDQNHVHISNGLEFVKDI
jgi:thiamine biosynthesis lipoprotein